MEQQLRVRFAPSPTGPFHIGGARSALFNWLLARKEGGKLILRIEDTDLERSTRESEENIKASLRWLGIEWDEGIDAGGEYGPYRQTERLDIYREYTDKLLTSGQAYHCYCSEAELEAERQEQMNKGENPHYAGRCRQLSQADRERFIAEGRKPTVRFRVPENRQIIFKDMVRDTVSFDSNGVGDFVIVKSDGIPVYNYAVVLDDALMKITHVIRAEEHLSNTPRQILLYQALGLELPKFGHISLILGKDRTKMSKRHGATSVEQYKNLGYLPEGIVNFLALLGWAPPGEEEIFSPTELIEQFSMDRVAKNPAVFDIDKLNHINAHYIKQASPELITELALPHLKAAGYVGEALSAEERAWLVKVVAELQGYISYAAQITEHIDVFFNDTIDFENEEAHEIMKDAAIPEVMAAFKNKLAALETVEPAAVQAILKGIVKELKLGGKKVYMPVRIAVTGKMHGPELINLIPLIGKDRTLARIDSLIAKI
ncbi:glutamate--tRNA ligase [Sporomusa sphaeroides]|uniref:Glutamate--tRNA ligase n=1 Tax=Sporomusa sphaeroides DSM 2875 TaxID=1337886 RepID=A0ABP2CA56_9FIRM|nr:glutamate--tRNA ligase [Sporomusa sphaeroides]OLS56900.1 glutamate--tRNA ligase [Sporomusa sphaeroides DSM 2875]CVK21192.1 Glutamate--tRNA ligase [Sporomusa sphaeroides DSM 2875]